MTFDGVAMEALIAVKGDRYTREQAAQSETQHVQFADQRVSPSRNSA